MTSWRKFFSKKPSVPKKRKIQYERGECQTFYAYVKFHYPDLAGDLERHECGGSRGKIERAMLKEEGMKPGFPDYFFYYPSGKFHGLAIEMKKSMRYGGSRPVTSPEQMERILRFRKRGYAAYVCEGEEEAVKVFRKYLKQSEY